MGDASGMQSPLSFGGLAALLRHIPRLADGVEDALLNDMLNRECLAALNQYQPALSASWLFQKCMSVSPVRTTLTYLYCRDVIFFVIVIFWGCGKEGRREGS